ncbi:MAG: DUF763 domain-containing protein [Candidatus Bathyarchaeota archaeon]|nr:MAG: DUF763 domain-containing protein [Candidatus Bathyarchaeota archaeon]
MPRTGTAALPLHYGKAPQWLTRRMTRLARRIITVFIEEYSQQTLLARLSDPHWFQALGCTLGYDWHSSGLTTVLTAVLKQATEPAEHGIAVCGGKGRLSRQTPIEITEAAQHLNLSTATAHRLRYVSRISAKVDNTAVQAGYPLYHHVILITEKAEWAIIQQGMNIQDRTARRYHWRSQNARDFLVEPHNAIVGDAKRQIALDMTARQSLQCQKTSTDIAKEEPAKIRRMLKSIRPKHQKSLQEWVRCINPTNYVVDTLYMPRNLNWKAIKQAYEFQPRNYEELLNITGIGPATIRGLALISQLIYGNAPSWKDPVKYSFAYGGKDGVPYPVNRQAMDESIHFLQNAIENARMGSREKLKALRRLRGYVPLDREIK